MRFYKGKAGRNAYRVSHVWRLGFHVFNNGGDRIIRLCYFRGKNTHYIQLSWVVKADLKESVGRIVKYVDDEIKEEGGDE